MSNKIKIAFFCPNLGGGGAEMHLARLLTHLSNEKFELDLILSRSGGDYLAFLPDYVKVHLLNGGKIPSGVIGMFQTIRPLSKKIKDLQPDLLFSIMDHSNIIAYYAHRLSKSKAKLIFSVQTPILQSLKFTWKPFNQIIRCMMPFIYPNADKIISLSEGVKHDLIKINKKLQSNTVVINNIGIERSSGIESKLPSDSYTKKIVVCGRLLKLKGFHDVIEALPMVLKQVQVELYILGDGPERDNLLQLAKSLAIDDNIKFLGFQRNPGQFMGQSDLFVLSSYYEGFGNVIIEAMALGLPVIATDCPYGPGEIITDGKNGLLVPVGSPRELANAIIKVLTNAKLQLSLSKSGKESVDKYSGSIIASQYEKCFLHEFSSSRE